MEALPEAVKHFVREARVCRIASVRPGGEPHVIPVCPVFDGDATLYVDLASHGVSAAAFRSNPSITVLIDEYHDDWSKLQAVILRCRAEELAGEEMERAWAMIFRLEIPSVSGIPGGKWCPMSRSPSAP